MTTFILKGCANACKCMQIVCKCIQLSANAPGQWYGPGACGCGWCHICLFLMAAVRQLRRGPVAEARPNMRPEGIKKLESLVPEDCKQFANIHANVCKRMQMHANLMQMYANVCKRMQTHANCMQIVCKLYANVCKCPQLHANCMQTYANVCKCMQMLCKLYTNCMQMYAIVCKCMQIACTCVQMWPEIAKPLRKC